MCPVRISPHQCSSGGPNCTPLLHPLPSSNREVGRLSLHIPTSSSRIRPWRYFIFHVKERTTAELNLALADLTHSSGRNKANLFPCNYSPPLGDTTSEAWLQFYWAVFAGEMDTEARQMEKGIDLSFRMLSFLGNICLLKIDLPSVFPDLLLFAPRRSKA